MEPLIQAHADVIVKLLPLINFAEKFAAYSNHFTTSIDDFFKKNEINNSVFEITKIKVEPYLDADYDFEKVFTQLKSIMPIGTLPDDVKNGKDMLSHVIKTNETYFKVPVELYESDIKLLSRIFERARAKYYERWLFAAPPALFTKYIPPELVPGFLVLFREVNGKRITGNMEQSLNDLNSFYCENSLIMTGDEAFKQVADRRLKFDEISQ